MVNALDDAAIDARLAALPGWERDGNSIRRTFLFEHYLAGIAYAAAVGTVCEGLNHHPDICIGWKRVTVSFTTHDAGNQLTEVDFDAADAIQRLGYPAGG